MDGFMRNESEEVRYAMPVNLQNEGTPSGGE
jgi:hypothetical protein